MIDETILLGGFNAELCLFLCEKIDMQQKKPTAKILSMPKTPLKRKENSKKLILEDVILPLKEIDDLLDAYFENLNTKTDETEKP